MDLAKDFETWNPMEKDFTNPEFNSYDVGPGVNFNDCYISKQNKDSGDNCVQHYIVLKFVPKFVTKRAVFNLCSQFGRVMDVRNSKKNEFIFVDVASFADKEAILRGMQSNSFGIMAFVGKPSNDKEEKKLKELSNQIGKYRTNTSVYKDRAELERRNVPVTSCKLKRPVFVDNSTIFENHKNENLIKNDPYQQFIVKNAAFVLKQLTKIKYKGIHHNSNYVSGRIYMETSEVQKNSLQSQLNLISSNYDDSTGIYKKEYKKEMVHCKNFFQSCENCNFYADVKCFKCSCRFCNLKCLKTMWCLHKRTCGNLKSLNANKFPSIIPNSGDKLIVKTNQLNKFFSPSNGSKVCLTSIINTNMVYVRSKEKESDELYIAVLNKIHKICKTQKKLSDVPKVGAVVVAKFGEQYNRALVLDNQSKNCIKLVYMDYGNLVCKSYLELYEFPESLNNLPQFISLVVLKKVPEYYMTAELRDFMYYYLNDINLKIIYNQTKDKIEDHNIYQVELIDSNTLRNLNSALIKIGHAVPFKNNLFMALNNLEHYPLPLGENIELLLMDNSFLKVGYLSCTSLEFALEIQRFNKDIETYGNSLLNDHDYTPRVNELCIAKYSVDNKWYRGRCIDVVGDGHPTILFIDYGNMGVVSIKKIRKYPKQFTFPIYTYECEIIEFSDCNDEVAVKKLEENLKESAVFTCRHLEITEDGHYKISLLNLLN